MKYHEPQSISRNEAEKCFLSGKPDQICDALVRIAFHDPDWRWAQAQCLRFIASSNNEIKGLAATCLGHLARIHRQLDIADVKAVLLKMTKDPIVGGRAEDALSDIQMYMENAE